MKLFPYLNCITASCHFVIRNLMKKRKVFFPNKIVTGRNADDWCFGPLLHVIQSIQEWTK